MSASLQAGPAVLLALLSLLALALPRRQALLALWMPVCLVPMGQEVVAANLHFPLFRLLLLVLALRVLLRGERQGARWSRTDGLLLAWACIAVPLGALADSAGPTLGNRLGDSYNVGLAYFVGRCLVRDLDDVATAVTQLALLSLVVAALMVGEQATGRNPLAALGGVPEFSQTRDGLPRSQGAFRHPLLAGAFGATQFPLFVVLGLTRPRRRLLAAAASAAALVIVATASSSGALLALGAALLGLAGWRLRHRMRAVRWGVLALLGVLAAVMSAPVWYLFARLSDVVGGGGWHRAWLIQQAVDHLDEWWLFGTNFTAHWGPAGDVIDADPDMMDITNQYIMEGVRGGMLRLALFVAVLATAFARVGRFARGRRAGGVDGRVLAWGLGVSLFAHCVTFLSVHYFDQMIVVPAVLLAAIVGTTGPAAARRPRAPAAAGDALVLPPSWEVAS